MSDNQDEIFADVFSDKKSAPKEPEPKVAEAPKPEPTPPPEPIAQKEASEVQPPPIAQQPAKEPERPRVDPEQFKGYLDEREKRQQLEREIAELRRQHQQSQQTKEPVPDVLDNPAGFQQHLETQYEQRLTRMKLEQSEFLATREYGNELVSEVKNWAARLDDARANHLISQPSPFHAAVEMFRQERAAAQLKEHDYDLEKLKAKWLAELQGQQPQAPQTQSAPGVLPPKIAGQGGGVGKAPTPSEDQIFRSVFSR